MWRACVLADVASCHEMPFYLRNKGSKCVSMRWRLRNDWRYLHHRRLGPRRQLTRHRATGPSPLLPSLLPHGVRVRAYTLTARHILLPGRTTRYLTVCYRVPVHPYTPAARRILLTDWWLITYQCARAHLPHPPPWPDARSLLSST